MGGRRGYTAGGWEVHGGRRWEKAPQAIQTVLTSCSPWGGGGDIVLPEGSAGKRGVVAPTAIESTEEKGPSKAQAAKEKACVLLICVLSGTT